MQYFPIVRTKTWMDSLIKERESIIEKLDHINLSIKRKLLNINASRNSNSNENVSSSKNISLSEFKLMLPNQKSCF